MADRAKDGAEGRGRLLATRRQGSRSRSARTRSLAAVSRSRSSPDPPSILLPPSSDSRPGRAYASDAIPRNLQQFRDSTRVMSLLHHSDNLSPGRDRMMHDFDRKMRRVRALRPSMCGAGMTGAEALLQTAAAAGVEVCFANPGTHRNGSG